MILPKSIRIEIADRMIHTVAPVIFFSMIVIGLGILFLGSQQYQRLIPTLVAMVMIIPAWVMANKGKPLIGIIFITACIVLGVISGMIFSGGIYAPAYMIMVVFITFFTILYGTRGGVICAIVTVAVGALFIQLSAVGVIAKVQEPPALLLLLLFCIFLTMQIFFVSIPARLMFQALNESQIQRQELQQAVQQRKQAQEELQSILSKTPDIIYRLDTDGNVTYISDAIRKFGYQPDDLIGKPFTEFVHPEDDALASHGLLERRTGKRGTQELEIRFMISGTASKQSGEGWVDPHWSTFLVSSDGLYADDIVSAETYRGTQGIAHDISLTRQIETRVAQLASVVEQAVEDVVITDPQGVILYVNPSFEAVTGYSRSEAIGQTLRILKSDRHDPAFFAEIRRTIASGKIWKGRIWNRTKDGREILQDITTTPIHDSAGNLTGYASVRRDITKQVEIEEQLRQSQKMEAIGRLAGGIAHDFNNILSAIIGYADLALEDVRDSEVGKKKIGRILEAGSRATDLIRQILSFSRNQEASPMPVSPRIIAKEVLKLIRASLPATIEIGQDLNSQSTVFADPTNIHQIFMNLCTNAGHAMRESGGIMTVSLEDVVLEKSEVVGYPGMVAGKFIKITVKDTGHGIPPNIQSKIFDPFFTTKAMGEGTGMGLSAVHGIASNLGGKVIVNSRPGEGAVFKVFLPIVNKPIEATSRAETGGALKGTERILFVDDETIQGELARDSLEPLGYRVSVFTDSIAAWEHFQAHPDKYDIVVTDLTMPKMTGDVLTQKIHLIRPEIPVIMCTGFSEIMDEEKSKTIGVDAILNKPVLTKKLTRIIRNILAD